MLSNFTLVGKILIIGIPVIIIVLIVLFTLSKGKNKKANNTKHNIVSNDDLIKIKEEIYVEFKEQLEILEQKVALLEGVYNEPELEVKPSLETQEEEMPIEIDLAENTILRNANVNNQELDQEYTAELLSQINEEVEVSEFGIEDIEEASPKNDKGLDLISDDVEEEESSDVDIELVKTQLVKVKKELDEKVAQFSVKMKEIELIEDASQRNEQKASLKKELEILKLQIIEFKKLEQEVLGAIN